jgi:hypothetical protein
MIVFGAFGIVGSTRIANKWSRTGAAGRLVNYHKTWVARRMVAGEAN